MAASIADRPATLEEIGALIDQRVPAVKYGRHLPQALPRVGRIATFSTLPEITQ